MDAHSNPKTAAIQSLCDCRNELVRARMQYTDDSPNAVKMVEKINKEIDGIDGSIMLLSSSLANE